MSLVKTFAQRREHRQKVEQARKKRPEDAYKTAKYDLTTERPEDTKAAWEMAKIVEGPFGLFGSAISPIMEYALKAANEEEFKKKLQEILDNEEHKFKQRIKAEDLPVKIPELIPHGARVIWARMAKELHEAEAAEPRTEEKVTELKEKLELLEVLSLQIAQPKLAEITVEGLGTNQLEYAVLTGEILKPDQKRRTIVIETGIGNHVGGVGALALQLASEGYRVIVLAQPDGAGSIASEELKNAVENDPSYDHHGQIVAKALEQLSESKEILDRDIQLIGFSLGAPISVSAFGSMDVKIRERVKRLSLLNPAAEPISPTMFLRGIVEEVWAARGGGGSYTKSP